MPSIKIATPSEAHDKKNDLKIDAISGQTFENSDLQNNENVVATVIE